MSAAVAVVRGTITRLVRLVVPDDANEGVHKALSYLACCVGLLEKESENSRCSESITEKEKEILQFAYDLEEYVESVLLAPAIDASAKRSTHNFSRLKDKVLRSLPSNRQLGHPHPMTSPYLEDLEEKRSKLGVELCNYHQISEPQAIRSYSLDFVGLMEKQMLGIDDVKKILINDNEKYPSPIISIVGVNGIGKTSFARKLYNDPSVVSHFHCRAWATVGQTFQARHIAATILGNLTLSGLPKEEIQEMEPIVLMVQLYMAQKGRKCLVVLDDVLSTQDWETIRFAFPLDAGTRIIITTPEEKVASKVGGYKQQMELLNTEQSWELFNNHTRIQNKDCKQLNQETEQKLQKLVSLCGGLSLAITIVGGMVRDGNLDWVNSAVDLLDNCQNREVGDSLLKILDLSYNNLPYQLKPCYLYFGLFLPDQLIPVEKLYLLWMAEGLIPSRKFGEDYLQELAKRSLLMVENEDSMGISKLKSCKLHKQIHNHCISQGQNEEFPGIMVFKSKPTGEKMSQARIRIAVYLDMYQDKDDYSLEFTFDTKHIHSLLFFDRGGSPSKSTWPKETSDLKEFHCARIMEFNEIDFQVRNFPRNIEKVQNLRHLSFRGCHLESLPPSFGDLHALETLDLLVRSSCKLIIPNIISKLSRLRHLYLPSTFRSATNDKLKLNGLTRLEVLENFHASICDAGDLMTLTSLQNLKAITDGNNEDLKKMMDFIKDKHLVHVSLSIRKYDCYSIKRREIVGKLLQCDYLHALDIEGHLGVILAEKFGRNITEMIFNGSEFQEDPMPILGKHENLKTLVLCNDAFVGDTMECTDEACFPKLRLLKLANLWALKVFKFQEGAMPHLSKLILEKCPSMQKFPDKLMKTPTLQEVKIQGMLVEFQEHARGLYESQRHCNVMLSVTFYN